MNSGLVNIDRLLKLNLPRGQSAYLWGPRQTGKSTFLKACFPDSVYYNLLKTDLYIALSTRPKLLREEVMALSQEALSRPIIIDEVQKVPALLDEIHFLIEEIGAHFILCGSSARKLKRGDANLLGGRAWVFHFYPLVYPEVPDMDLLHVLRNGMIPSHYLMDDATRSFRAYVELYLKEEIQAEGLVRSLPHFARFLESLRFSHGELVNYQNISRECGVDQKTVKNYYQILVDTLLGYYLPPFRKKVRRDILLATQKFYLFDVGIANHLLKRDIQLLRGSDAGSAFEHYMLMELMGYRGLSEKDIEISYWRTKSGLEVDFIIGDGEVAIEAKISKKVDKSDLKGLIAFQEEHKPKKAIAVCNVERARKLTVKDNVVIHVLPWKVFLKMLWAGDIF